MIDPERWRRIEEIFHAALERSGAERARLLDTLSAGDEDLRREVVSLLDAEGLTGGPTLETAVSAAADRLVGGSHDYTGQVLGRYRITARIGRGGMGEVYRAEDTSLRRPVALKILRPEFLGDRERRTRFEDEARAASALNHPNILVIHEIGRAGGIDFIATELVEGETLDARLVAGPLAWRDVLAIAIQTAQALAAAHAAGIVHRDIKPHNIMVRPDGVVKVVDFGIAKLAERTAAAGAVDATNQRSATRSGTIMGTVCYMSPEQALGESVDHRSDIFSLGVVLYQMATGVVPFDGSTDAAVHDALLGHSPGPASALRPELPTDLDRVLSRVLEKDTEVRYQTAGDLAADLKRLQRASTGLRVKPAVESSDSRTVQSPASSSAKPWMFVAAAAIVLAATAWVPRLLDRSGSSAPPLRHFVVPVPAIVEPDQATGSTVVISPDGNRLVYVRGPVGTRQLYVRQMDQLEDQPIAGTELGQTPFFSPDGGRLGFFAQGELRFVPLAGGPASALWKGTGQRGAAWSPDGSVVLAADEGLIRLAAGSGAATIARPRPELGERAYQFPEILPDARTLLYTVIGRDDRQRDTLGVHALRFDTLERRAILPNASTARYARSGHLVFYRDGGLAAVPFDPVRAATTGPPVAVRSEVAAIPGGVVPDSGASFSLSNDGTLVYLSGSTRPVSKIPVWVSRTGAVELIGEGAPGLVDPNLSPDGRTLALVLRQELWLIDLQFGARRKLRGEPGSVYMAPVWTLDGQRLAYTRVDEAGGGIYSVSVANPDRETMIWNFGGAMSYPAAFTRDGRTLVCVRSQGLRRYDIWMVRIDDAQKSDAQAILATTANEQHPQLSPDGRWLAYASDEAGRPDVYVQPFPIRGDKWRVSVNGGVEPRWASNGRELFYRSGDRLMSVRFDEAPAFVPGQPRRLFEGNYQDVGDVIDYAVAPGGDRFLMIRATEPDPPYTKVQVILNWFTELGRLAPVTVSSRRGGGS